MKVLLDADDYDTLFKSEEQSAVLDWIDQVAPGRWVFTLEVLAEGKIRLLTTRKDAITFFDWGEHGADIFKTAVYVSEEPPRCVFAAMAR